MGLELTSEDLSRKRTVPKVPRATFSPMWHGQLLHSRALSLALCGDQSYSGKIPGLTHSA